VVLSLLQTLLDRRLVGTPGRAGRNSRAPRHDRAQDRHRHDRVGDPAPEPVLPGALMLGAGDAHPRFAVLANARRNWTGTPMAPFTTIRIAPPCSSFPDRTTT